jgi:prepilin-type N-terminal cleavage/methylation domain-containing protein
MRAKAFTLIELLIVVAIIAILAAIAVPNFLEAQVRAKVSRSLADMRSIATALETYAVDNNNYPPDLDSRGWPYYLTDAITTPIAYMSGQRNLIDTFRKRDPAHEDLVRLRYLNYPAELNPGWNPCQFPGPYRTRWVTGQPASVINPAIQAFGKYKVCCAGPDATVNTAFFTADLLYDPSNGTVSGGDIVRYGNGRTTQQKPIL